jgi:hypothetical protein
MLPPLQTVDGPLQHFDQNTLLHIKNFGNIKTAVIHCRSFDAITLGQRPKEKGR